MRAWFKVLTQSWSRHNLFQNYWNNSHHMDAENKRSIWCVEFFSATQESWGFVKQLCVHLCLWHQQFSSKVWLGKENLNYFKVVLSIWCFWEGFPNRHLHVIGKWGVGSLGTVHIYICMLKGLRVPWDLFEQENLVTLGRTILLVKGTASVFFSSQTTYPLVALGQITPRSA